MEKRTNREAEAVQARPKRTPLGSRNVLTVAQRKGYHRVWVSNSDSIRPSIEDYKLAGYTFVQDSLKVGDASVNQADPLATTVSRAGGRGIQLFLMEIAQEWYDEDQAKQQEEIREREMGIFSADKRAGQYGEIKNKSVKGKGAEEYTEDL